MSLLDVFDLPQLYTKPTAAALLDTLALLTSAPPSWEYSDIEDGKLIEGSLDKRKTARTKAVQVSPEGVTRYLTGIVSSSLKWIHDEEAKEEIWNQASIRLSERSGRTAMGAISRNFRIPTATSFFELSIHEPALTGDDLGLKTWAASYLLSKRLHKFGPAINGHQRLQVLELGSGTGLVGLAMAGLGADVVLTDLPSIYQNLARNARDNAAVVQQGGGSTQTGVLDWTNPTSCNILPPDSNPAGEGLALSAKFPLILAADSLYSPDHPGMLVNTIKYWLCEDDDAKVIVEFPYRDAYLPQIKDFRERMETIGLCVLDEGEEQGYDDWGSSGAQRDEDDRALVTCWWSCWGRAP
ncbi:hypothetical protein BS50DRAFT_588197 [Corynespora cassiicola Philippines]|uniref:Glucose-inducible SAM-dependent methyltransferase Rrg1 n=1 Tax=Corynespora cassiicola Philippines TaxID=1448308 RepID=A0A2T2NP33_CORCC|nr:hypothetical protein BS50DRAFT_588197 [Corynespora cassiicola Philippines]